MRCTSTVASQVESSPLTVRGRCCEGACRSRSGSRNALDFEGVSCVLCTTELPVAVRPYYYPLAVPCRAV